ncbi:unnamed protein product [Durusdinium trenchii]|uniref:Uncharacterized protein n=2 Tax=Durusdinium trenchii TaxID=1381693 RepID=A0ABP0HJX7_9DINO
MFVKVVLCAVVWLVSAYTAAYPWLLWPGIDPSVATGMFDRRWLNLVVMVIFMVLIACCQFKRHPPSALAYDAKWCVFGSWLELLAIILYEVAKANERLAHDSNHLMDFFLCMAYSIESVVLAWTLGAFRCHISSLQLSKNELPCGWIYIMSLALIAQVLVNVIQRYFDTTSFSLLLSILLLAVFLVILATYTAKFCLVLSRGLHVLLVEASRVEGSARRNMIWAAKVLRLELTVVFLFGVTVFVAWSCIFAIRVLKLASEEDYGTLRGRLWNYASLLRRFAWAFSSTCLTGILWQGREPSEDESGTETRRHASSATRLSDDMGEEDREIFKATVEDLAGRGLTLRSLTGFWGDLLDLEIMPHFDPRLSSTNDVVRQAIIPMSRQGSGGKALACLWEDQPLFPTTMVTHNWSNVFGHLVAAVLADALGKDTYAGVAAQLTSKKGLEQLKLHLDAEGKLDSTCWICAFSVNQHASICGGFGPEPDRVREPERWKCWDRSRRDSVTDRAFLVCSCQVPKAFDQSDASCEINKFDDMMHFLQQQDIGFGQLVVVDEHFGVLHRAWCIAEIVEGNTIAGEDGNFRMRATVYSQNSVFLNYDSLAVLDVRECCATLEKDREFILSKIEGQEAEFNMKLQNFIFGSKGLFRTWVDSRERGRRVAFIWRKAAALASENLHPSCAERVVEFFLFRPPIWCRWDTIEPDLRDGAEMSRV